MSEPVTRWRDEQRLRSAFRCEAIPLAEVGRWRRDAMTLRHDSSGFFAIIAACSRSNDPALDGAAQPFILQTEIGILGFLARPGAPGAGPDLLVQAKTEPGNEGAVQLAPSFQCTPSNYTARHGGVPAPLLGLFADAASGSVVADLSQSEQGTRFLGKFNRNMVIALPPGQAPDPPGPAWRWMPASTLRGLLLHDNVVNTDARSVLVGTRWRFWADGAPFARWRGSAGFGAALLEACDRVHSDGDRDEAENWLAASRAATRIETSRIAFADLPGWRIDDAAMQPDGPGRFAIRGYRVQARDREVANWDQPLVDSAGTGRIVLLCQHRQGRLRFLVQARAESGLANRVEIAPSLQIAPGEVASPGIEQQLEALAATGTVRLACRQSEEGGRFHRDANTYAVIELPAGALAEPPATYRWIDLATLEALCTTPGRVTNEGRSAASLLLALA